MTDASASRQHHLDALRAFAMLLGIGLHAALSFTDTFWVTKDHFRSEFLGYFFEAIHGFRMQLFFLVSGYFTMMMFRRRGLATMMEQRYQRVFVPCIIGLVTILPIMEYVTTWAADTTPKKVVSNTPKKKVEPPKPSALIEAIRAADHEKVESLLAEGADPNQTDKEFRLPALSWAALHGDPKLVKTLLDRKANPNVSNRDGETPLHHAALMGRHEVVPLLIERGADLGARNKNDETALDATKTEWLATRYLAVDLQITIGNEDEMKANRERVVQLLEASADAKQLAPLEPNPWTVRLNDWRNDYLEFMTSPRWNLRLSQGNPVHLILTPQFSHLWFLWFLCWLVVLFAIFAKIFELLRLPRLGGGVILSRFRLLWLVPITLVPQLLMGLILGTFGPDTALGVIPPPHLLCYYAIFFAVGAFYHDAEDTTGRLGRDWWFWLLLAAGTYYFARETTDRLFLNSLLQVFYVWSMIFGLMGLFRNLLSAENRLIRYLSDSAYWLYLIHLPLVIYLQAVVRAWEYPAIVKFLGVVSVATVVLLISYQLLVRNTYVGVILNGRRASRREENR